ncbi:MAG: hypothetical protein K8R60_22055 [Burkholderiales bacterium]|nr:hypothetical protein [Burkholderiales bacterium]
MTPSARSIRSAARVQWLGAWLFCLATAGAFAAEAPAASSPAAAASAALDSSARISAERTAVNARYAERERECRTRFIVSSCIDEAKRDRRQELDRLRARQIIVDEARRHERAEARRAEVAAKAAEDAKREAERAARAADAPASASSAAARGRLVPVGRARRSAGAASGAASDAASGEPARPRSSGDALGLGGKPPATPAEREAEAARSRAEFEARQRRAAEHRDDAATQAIRRMGAKAPASSLPAPSAASAAASAAKR